MGHKFKAQFTGEMDKADVQGCTNAASAGSAGAAIQTDYDDRTQKAFTVPKDELKANKYDLSINRYKEVVYEEEQL